VITEKNHTEVPAPNQFFWQKHLVEYWKC